MESTERGQKVVTYNPIQFTEAVQKMTFISNPLNELASSPTATIYIGTKCCSLRCTYPISCCCTCTGGCVDFFRYHTVINAGGAQKYLFRNVAKIGCSLCSTDKISRFEGCKSMALSSFDQYSELDGGVEYCEMAKDAGCFCFGCCDMDLKVNIPKENRAAGVVKFRGCCSMCCAKDKPKCCQDCCRRAIYCCDILNANNEVVYVIYLILCCCTCIPDDWYPSFVFEIRDLVHNVVGKIDAIRNCCNFYGMCGNNFTYNITFPSDATPELKLTIINSVIANDLFML